MGSLTGLNLVLSNLLPKKVKTWQWRFPRSKRKRIQKKWAKDRRNWRSKEEPVIYKVGDIFYCNQVALDQIYRELRK